MSLEMRAAPRAASGGAGPRAPRARSSPACDVRANPSERESHSVTLAPRSTASPAAGDCDSTRAPSPARRARSPHSSRRRSASRGGSRCRSGTRHRRGARRARRPLCCSRPSKRTVRRAPQVLDHLAKHRCRDLAAVVVPAARIVDHDHAHQRRDDRPARMPTNDDMYMPRRVRCRWPHPTSARCRSCRRSGSPRHARRVAVPLSTTALQHLAQRRAVASLNTRCSACGLSRRTRLPRASRTSRTRRRLHQHATVRDRGVRQRQLQRRHRDLVADRDGRDTSAPDQCSGLRRRPAVSPGNCTPVRLPKPSEVA